jgi:hypothetical protein
LRKLSHVKAIEPWAIEDVSADSLLENAFAVMEILIVIHNLGKNKLLERLTLKIENKEQTGAKDSRFKGKSCTCATNPCFWYHTIYNDLNK